MKTPLKAQIIKEWEKVEQKHPSYGEVAKIVGCDKTYVWKIIKAYKAQNLVFGLKK